MFDGPGQGRASLMVDIINLAVTQSRMYEQCEHYTPLMPLIYQIVWHPKSEWSFWHNASCNAEELKRSYGVLFQLDEEQ